MWRAIVTVVSLTLLSACAVQQAARTSACERTISLYARYVDLGVPAEVADLFAEEATWQLGETRLKGREVIRAYFALLSKDPARVSRHSQSNIVIDWDSATRARGTVYLTLYRGTRREQAFAPVAGQPLFVGHYDDEYQFIDGRCEISRRVVVPAFKTELFTIRGLRPLIAT